MNKYPKLTDEDLSKKEFFGIAGNAELALKNQKDQCFNVISADITAGASGATVTELVFIAPTKLKIISANFLVVTPQTGTGNTPVVKLQQGSTDIAATGAIALSGAAGDVEALTVNADECEIDAGTVLKAAIVNPAGTITTALKGKLQIEWNSIP